MPDSIDLHQDDYTTQMSTPWVYSSTEYYHRESSLLAVWVAIAVVVFVIIFCLCVWLFVYLGWGWWCCADRDDCS